MSQLALVAEAVTVTVVVTPASPVEPQGQVIATETPQADPITVTTEQTQTASPPLPQSEGQPGETSQSSESDVDLTQFKRVERSSRPYSSAPAPPVDP